MTIRAGVPLLGAALVLACDGGVEIQGQGGSSTTEPPGVCSHQGGATSSGGRVECEGGIGAGGAPACIDGLAVSYPGLCLPQPSRIIFLGDSIFACYGIEGGKNGKDCGPRIVATHVAERFGAVSYENLAVSGAVTTDVPDREIPLLSELPGHALVVVLVGGNDLTPYYAMDDAEARAGWQQAMSSWSQTWDEIFARLADGSLFPDGATVVLNTQYDPFDDCTASPYQEMSPVKRELLADFNRALAERATASDSVFLVDQHAAFLGHGRHYATDCCPYYEPDSDPWLLDGVHPNPEGHRAMARQLIARIDALYAGCGGS